MQKERLDFSPIVTQSVERYQPLAEEKQLHISSSITSQVFVQGDGALLRQIAENLISNAVKYSPAGSNPIMVQLTSDSLVVSDHGVGISEEALPHIFDRFYQEDGSRAHGGFGLGLSLVKRIVDLHGWSIGIKSAPAKGTTVVVRFGSRKTPKAVS